MSNKVSDNLNPKLILVEGSAPASPASGNQALFVASSNHHLSRVNSAGTVVDMETLSGYAPSLISKTSNYTLISTDTGILGDATSGAITLTLPTAVASTALYFLAKKDSGTNTVTIATTSAQTINGTSTVVLSAQYAGIVVLSDGANWRIVAQVPVGGGSGAMTLISSNVLGTTTASVTFSSIPGTYNSLLLIWSARGDVAATSTILNVVCNADTGANYNYAEGRFDLSATGETSGGGINAASIGHVAGSTAPSNYFNGGDLLLPRYAATVQNKAMVARSARMDAVSNSGMWIEVDAAWWASTAALTSLQLIPASGNFITGSAFYLYGLT